MIDPLNFPRAFSTRRSRAGWRRLNAAGANSYAAGGAETDTLGTVAFAVDSIIVVPFVAGFGFRVQNLNFEVTVGGAAGSVARIGLYLNREDAPRGLDPGTLLFDSGSIDTTIVGVKVIAVAPAVPLDPDQLYWLAYLCGVASPTIRIGTGVGNAGIIGFASGSGFASQINSYAVAQAYGALPNPFPTAGVVRQLGNYPLLLFGT